MITVWAEEAPAYFVTSWVNLPVEFSIRGKINVWLITMLAGQTGGREGFLFIIQLINISILQSEHKVFPFIHASRGRVCLGHTSRGGGRAGAHSPTGGV